MFRLRVLGGFALEGPSGAAQFPVPQRRAEAVLAVLAACGDVGCTRERLIALLWPESDEARSRRALRNTLHTLRQALGPDVVLSAGELLRLDPSAITSDVHAFVEARASGRSADAVQAYGGDLLEGFHVDGAPEFERWLDGERARLARQCGETFEQLATAAEGAGAWGEAASWWAQAEERDPLNSHLVLRHVEALAAIGDRANAIRMADAHARRLREEFELELDPEVRERFERIRRGVTSGNGARMARPLPAADDRAAGTVVPPVQLLPRAMPAAGHEPAAVVPAPVLRSGRRVVAAAAVGAVLLLVAAIVLLRPQARRAPDPAPLDPAAIAVLPFQVVGADSGSPARLLARRMGDLFELKVTGEFGRHIRHPGSVAWRWREAGGSLDSALSEGAELAVARSVGAGRLVRGTVVASGDSLVVSASMMDVATGALRVRPVRVEGSVARWQQLVDRLIILLLARDAGITPEEAPRLADFKPEAIQAYLAGNAAESFAPQKPFYHAALAADSNLADAAVMLYATGEDVGDTGSLRYAWEHQDRLTERSRAYLQVLAAGRHGSIRTEAEKIAGYEALASRWPEWRTPWGELGDQLTDFGALASIPDWSRTAREALERMARRYDWAWWHLVELAFVAGDAARARAAIDTLAGIRAITPLIRVKLSAYRWRLALLEGDAAEAARQLARVEDTAAALQFALTDGRGIGPELDRAAPGAAPVAAMWGWARGHEQAWRQAWRRYGSPAKNGVSQAAVPVFWAMLLGPSADSIAAPSVRRLERIASGREVSGAGADDRTLARCWVVVWRLWHRDTTGAMATRRYLESDPDRRYRFAGWARLMDVLLAEAAGGDVHGALLRMDSVVRELPLPSGYLQWDPLPSELHNLVLARELGRYGEPARALAAARRRIYRGVLNYPDALPEYLREEGRHAALMGDTAGAIRAYRHYLALREDPDPPWRPAWDSVRTELAALVGR